MITSRPTFSVSTIEVGGRFHLINGTQVPTHFQSAPWRSNAAGHPYPGMPERLLHGTESPEHRRPLAFSTVVPKLHPGRGLAIETRPVSSPLIGEFLVSFTLHSAKHFAERERSCLIDGRNHQWPDHSPI